jgi:hypothetical protein
MQYDGCLDLLAGRARELLQRRDVGDEDLMVVRHPGGVEVFAI